MSDSISNRAAYRDFRFTVDPSRADAIRDQLNREFNEYMRLHRNFEYTWQTARPNRIGEIYEKPLLKKEMNKVNNDEIMVKCEITGLKGPASSMYKSHKDLVINDTTGECTFEIAYVTKIEYKAAIIDEKGRFYDVASRDEALKCNFIEGYNSGNFFTTKLAKKLYDKKAPPTKDYKGQKCYKEDDKKHNIKFGLWSPTDMITENKGYTFGIEIETTSGIVPLHLYKDLNMSAVFDGSIRDKNGKKVGKEYVTGVLQGDQGFLQLQKICNQLAKRTTVNKTCGIHVHIGNIQFSKEFIVYSYLLGGLIRDEMFSILPKSRNNNIYCHDLEPIRHNINDNMTKSEYKMGVDQLYNDIFYYLSQNFPGKKINKTKQHPRGASAGYNRNHPRYAWLNFLPAVFNIRNVREFKNLEEQLRYNNGDTYSGKIKSYTLEFRNHGASTSFYKIKNWTLICMAFVYFVEYNKREILKGKKITLEQIIEFAYPKTKTRLLEYVAKRKAEFASEEADLYEKNDYKKQRAVCVKEINIKELIKR